MVVRVHLHSMQQDHDGTVRSFGARLSGQASVCKFGSECSSCKKGVDYTNSILRDILTRGIADADIQLDVLSAKNQDMSLDEAFKFIEAKEVGKRSASRLLDSHRAEAARSMYCTHQKASLAPRPDECCGYCGTVGHGRNAPPSVRKKACPAFQHSCKHCGRCTHFDDLCLSEDRPRCLPAHNTKTDQVNTTEDCEGTVFDALCSIQTLGQHKGNSSVVLDHHVYDNLCNWWLLQASRPQPFLSISVSVSQEDYQDFGFKLTRSTKPTTLLAIADTGCQSCLVGMKAVSRLGLRADDLIPVSMKMHAANNHSIKILGAVILRFSGKSASGNHMESRQISYVTDASDKLFLSREACISLGMISAQFPQIGEAIVTHHVGSLEEDDPNLQPPISHIRETEPDPPHFDCQKCTQPPPTPTELPYPATEAKRERLQEFLLDYYGSSTFNTCPHERLPLMEAPLMRLMVDHSAQPVAHHKAIPIPLHWCDDVKAGLDRDVQLGILEPVPIGEPVTWCHRIVVCAKKDRSPRRTVVLQALNLHATRETHHT